MKSERNLKGSSTLDIAPPERRIKDLDFAKEKYMSSRKVSELL
jgi:hypothetical protein